MKITKPPKNRFFLGLVKSANPYWDIFSWATKEDGVDKACYVDSGLFKMPEIYGWTELPAIEEDMLKEK